MITLRVPAFFGLALACSSSSMDAQTPVDLSKDQVVQGGEEGIAAGDAELEGSDYLVQIEKEYKVAEFEGGGAPTGVTSFFLVTGGRVKTGSYYLTRKAGMTDITAGKTACFFYDNQKDEVFHKPPSKDAARKGTWRCRVVRDLSDPTFVLVGDHKVAHDNLRVENKLGGGLE